MTVVEFLDKNPIENMINTVTLAPDRVLFLGGESGEEQIRIYRDFLRWKGLNTEVIFYPVDRNSLSPIVQALEKIVTSDDTFCFDLTGGDDLSLVAMGIIYQKYRTERNIQMHRIHIPSGKVTDCDGDGVLPDFRPMRMGVEEHIRLHGCAVSSVDAVTFDFDREERADLRRIWEICRIDPTLYNQGINGLNELKKTSGTLTDGLAVRIPAYSGEKQSAYNRNRRAAVQLLSSLAKCGVIRELHADGGRLSFRYKSACVRHCLAKAGNILENHVLLTARSIRDGDGFFYHDAQGGVVIDWDGKQHRNDDATSNEIDVILMHGLIPVYISCKNGSVQDDELYKLNTVAAYSGGAYAKKVLIATEWNKTPSALQHFRSRAADMGITLIENTHKMSDQQLRRRLKSLVDS